MNQPSKLERFVRVRIIGAIDLVEALLRIVFGEKAPNLSMRYMVWETERRMERSGYKRKES